MMAATRGVGFGREVQRRILLGTHALSHGYYDAWYGQAQRVRACLKTDFRAAFDEVDLIVGPTTPTRAFALGDKTRDPVSMYRSDVLTVPASLAGLPALSVPCTSPPLEVDKDSDAYLPVGLQWIGPHGADGRVLRAGRAFQAITTHHAHVAPETRWLA